MDEENLSMQWGIDKENVLKKRKRKKQDKRYVSMMKKQREEERKEKKRYQKTKNILWRFIVFVFTFIISDCCLSVCGKMKTSEKRYLWREKFSLCVLIFLLMLFVGFISFGFPFLFCRRRKHVKSIEEVLKSENTFVIHGNVYTISSFDSFLNVNEKEIRKIFQEGKTDLSHRFQRELNKCKKPPFPCYEAKTGKEVVCYNKKNVNITKEVSIKKETKLCFFWKEIKKKSSLVVFNGLVLDMSSYVRTVSKKKFYFSFGKFFDLKIRTLFGKDASLYIASLDQQTQDCLIENFRVGYLEKEPFGCIFTNTILLIIFLLIFSILFVKTIFAILFILGINNISDNNDFFKKKTDGSLYQSNVFTEESQQRTTFEDLLKQEKKDKQEKTDHPLSIIIFIACYSESRCEIKRTLDSIVEADYSSKKKLIFIVSDGFVKGKKNKETTPEIILSMIEVISKEKHIPVPYIAVSNEERQVNFVKIYTGWYINGFNKTAVVLIIKCGATWEKNTEKPGNRGKRDSQVMLMSLLSKGMFDDRLSPFEFEAIKKIYELTGVFISSYDLLLMIDADTTVEKKSLSIMENYMRRDSLLIGVCGETKISNKMKNWVTKIQIFEYYISHYFNKAFESFFGSVTCLPGCFSMYRIKAQKDNGRWVPIIASPEIINQYSNNNVNTLHEKNLLLLGEDRYLTTLVLKTYPRRKISFIPKSVCWTSVPDKFQILLSQRRRWNNSTIHNLFELLTVPGMCGFFCFSMNFVVFIELIGGLILPASVIFTFVMFFVSILYEPQYMVLLLFCFVFIFPPLMVLLITRRFSHIFWFFIYICSLPIWNFIIPLYSFWNFDDVSWGETRKIKMAGTKFMGDILNVDSVPLKKWNEWISLEKHLTDKRS